VTARPIASSDGVLICGVLVLLERYQNATDLVTVEFNRSALVYPTFQH
jgi:hypothetical protein